MENGKWKMENGKWKMENGKWKMENGKLNAYFLNFNDVRTIIFYDDCLKLGFAIADLAMDGAGRGQPARALAGRAGGRPVGGLAAMAPGRETK